ncbi:MAG: succinate dehydrogenase, hydrophobic membrane anchor protein [Sphingomonadales bacterium]
MDLRTPLGRVRGRGSAKDGTSHWWRQRLTAMALVPLVIWFVTSMAGLAGADYATTVAWLSSPLVAIVMLALLLAGFYHMKLGLQAVIEDYVHDAAAKITAQILVLFATVGLGLACVFAVLKLAVGV